MSEIPTNAAVEAAAIALEGATADQWANTPEHLRDHRRDLARKALVAAAGAGIMDHVAGGADLLQRLRVQADDDEDYVSLLERHVTEGLRLNVGIQMENAEMRRRLHHG